MSVANILDTPVNTFQKIDPLWETSGGGGGPFLPLAGGTMDPLPNGVISAHTIEDIITLEGTPAGSGFDTTIITNTGNDLNLQTGTTDGLNVDTGQMTIDAAIRTEINATTVIQPVGGYTYPNNPEVGLTIQNWVNPNPAATVGALVQNIEAPNSAAYGVRIRDVGDLLHRGNSIGADVNGILQDRTFPTTFSAGVRISNIEAETSYGIGINSITSQDGEGNGIDIRTISGAGSGSACGINVIDVGNAGTNTATGISVDTISASSSTAVGAKIGNVAGNAFSAGVDVNTVSDGAGDANGIIINNIIGATEARGAYIQNITANGSTAVGVEIDGLAANGAGQDGRGVSVNNMVSDGNCVGVEARVLDSTSQTTTGFRASLLTAAGQVFGARFSSIGTLSGISEAYGIDMTNIRQNPAAVGTIGRGVKMNSIEAYDAAGVDITSVYGNQRAVGVNINDVKTTNVAVPAYGLSATRGTKLAASTGQLMRLIDGNLGLAVQFLNNPIAPQQVFGDGGNLCIIGVAAPAGPASINLVAPPGGWEDGHWFLFCKVAAVGHGIIDTAGNPINGAGAFIFPPGAAYDMCLIFFSVAFGGWVANAF